jgi:hypothetical protein
MTIHGQCLMFIDVCSGDGIRPYKQLELRTFFFFKLQPYGLDNKTSTILRGAVAELLAKLLLQCQP